MDDTDVKTEGTLKARFEQAEEISPSILLLRNVDALVRKSQKMETGKGTRSVQNVLSVWALTAYSKNQRYLRRSKNVLPILNWHDLEAGSPLW